MDKSADPLKEKKLSTREKLFIKFYLQCRNAAEAARRAGYSYKVAKEIGYENLTKPHIKKIISAKIKKLESALDISAAMVLDELKDIAFREMALEGTLKYKEKLKALELLGRYLKVFPNEKKES